MGTHSVAPAARTEDLLAREVDGDFVVYDLASDQAHLLNSSAASIWHLCDGTRSPAEIAEGAGLPVEAVVLALQDLERSGLLRPLILDEQLSTSLSRRAVLRKMGIAAVAIPVIISIQAAPAAAQTSCTGRPCGNVPGGAGVCLSTQCLNTAFCCTTGPRNNTCQAPTGC